MSESQTQRRKFLKLGALGVIGTAASGRYNHKGDADNHDFTHPKTGALIKRDHDPSFQYWGRTISNEQGEYEFLTIVPGFYPANLETGWYRPPHIHYMVSATGYEQLVTQLYFRGEGIKNNDFIQELNKKDFLLQTDRITHQERHRLMVEFKNDNTTHGVLEGEFDLQLKR